MTPPHTWTARTRSSNLGYRPVPGGPPPDLSRFFDAQADTLLDELVRIIFPQNMKSMETYYRWVAIQYAAQQRRIHHRLVETLFRYNGRPQMGGFLHRLSELVSRPGVARHTAKAHPGNPGRPTPA